MENLEFRIQNDVSRIARIGGGMRILLVDDEIEMAEAVARVLVREGYTVERAHEGVTGQSIALTQGFDLFILDWMLPGVTGLEICRSLRLASKMTPVLFLTAKDTLDDRVNGLDAGADDYLVKPFELRELLARVRALLRRRPQQLSHPQPLRGRFELKIWNSKRPINWPSDRAKPSICLKKKRSS